MKINQAKIENKYYCIDINRKILKNETTVLKYQFIDNYYLCGKKDSPQFQELLKILNINADPIGVNIVSASVSTVTPTSETSSQPSAKPKFKISKNEFGNYEERNTHIVFEIQDGRATKAIGYQDSDTGEVLPLTEENIKTCLKYHWGI